jgi:hypothetical protein
MVRDPHKQPASYERILGKSEHAQYKKYWIQQEYKEIMHWI